MRAQEERERAICCGDAAQERRELKRVMMEESQGFA
jgi:hypothetical protein